MQYRYRVRGRVRCHDGFFQMDRLELEHELYQGGMGQPIVRELMTREPVVAVLPYDPASDSVVLIEQFRVGALGQVETPWLVEIVAGIVESGETPEAVAVRELREEAGCDLMDLIPICRYLSSPGGLSEHVSLYCALVDASDAAGIYGLSEEGEDIRAFVLSREAALERVLRGTVSSAPPIIALQWLQMNHGRLKA